MVSSTAPVVLITGANQGLGFNIAKVLSNSKIPYTILVGARNITRGDEAVAKLLESKSNAESKISSITVDLSSSESIAAAIAKITTDHGRLDILVNNAGTGFGPGTNSSKRSDWQAIFDVNVFGTMEMTQSAFPLLEQTVDSKVVVVTSNVGSINLAAGGHIPMGEMGSPYSASKAAINMMMVNWTHTHPTVKYWGICPGLCATEFGGDFTKQYGRDPYVAADIVRQCVEGEKNQGIGRVSWDEKGLKFGDGGVYDW